MNDIQAMAVKFPSGSRCFQRILGFVRCDRKAGGENLLSEDRI